MLVAIFQPDNQPMAIASFSPEVTDIHQVAQRLVPLGVPFWLVPKADIDALYAEQGEWRDAWEIDADAIGREPDGVGEAA